VYTIERKHIGTKWSSVTCLALALAADQSLGSHVLEDSESSRRLTIATGNKQLQTKNKQYTKQYLKTKQTIPKDATHRYELGSAKIT
jgi:hypothetical protein